MAPRSMIEWYRRFGGTSLLCRHVWNRLLLPVIYPKMYSLTQPFIKQLLLNDISNHISQLRVSPVLSFNNNCLMESCVRLIFCIYIYITVHSTQRGCLTWKLKKKTLKIAVTCHIPKPIFHPLIINMEENEAEHVWNVMAHAQKPDLVFQRNGRVHLNWRMGVSSVDCWQPRCAHQQ